jgi:hypothetical protein
MTGIARDAETAALRDRLARADEREREVAGALQRDIERIAHDMRLYYDGWFETMRRDRLAVAEPMLDICRPIGDWMLRLDSLARIVPLVFATPTDGAAPPQKEN